MTEDKMPVESLAANGHFNSPLLSQVKSEVGLQILRGATLSTWQLGSQIVDQFDLANEVYFLISGRCRAVFFSKDGVAVGFRTISPGDCFGELGVLTNQPRVSAVISEEDSKTARLSGADFRQLLLVEPEMSLAVLRNLAIVIQNLTARLVEHSTLNVGDRIRAELVRMERSCSKASDNAGAIPMITHERLASIIGVNREVVTRELRSMQKAGLIDYDRRSLRIVKSGAFENAPQMLML